jgi:hypothetical protein
MGKSNFFLSTLPFSPWGSFSHMAACRSSSKNIGKMNLIPILNKPSPTRRKPYLNRVFFYWPWAHIESELGVLGVYGKLAKYVVHSSKRKIEKKLFFFTQAAQTTID